MDEDLCKVRIEEQLKVKIGEAKSINFRNLNEIYCTISLDQERIFRTSTIERNSSTSVFFGEEFQFEIPRKFRFLAIYVNGRDRHLKPDKVLGKIAIRRDDLKTYNNNKDYWFGVYPVDADSEVQGKINIEMYFEIDRLVVKVLECAELTVRNGNSNCDPYVQILCVYKNGKKLTKRTKCRRKTCSPIFNEQFEFEMNFEPQQTSRPVQQRAGTHLVYPKYESELVEVSVSVWHSTAGMSDDRFLGEIRIPIGEQFERNAWYLLQPRLQKNKEQKSNCCTPPGTRLSSESSAAFGSIRLKIQYTADHVFPAHVYEPFANAILASIDTQPISLSTVCLLSAIVPNNCEIAEPLVRVFLHYNQIVQIICNLAKLEISKLTDPTTIFRGNTLVSKMMDELMRVSGLHYLHRTLKPTIQAIFNERKPCEIDPARVKDAHQIQTNLANLKNYVQLIFQAIIDSAAHCPSLMCEIFHNLKSISHQCFPQHHEVTYSVISGFIFLRFFAPAILGPRLFHLTTEQIDNQVNRTLTLISKTIQSLGNLVSVRSACTSTNQQQQDLSTLIGCKETYMECLWQFFNTDQHVQAVRHFLEIISTTKPVQITAAPGTVSDPEIAPIILKEGYLVKRRAQHRRRFGLPKFKRRYFKLTAHDLTYARSKSKKAISQIAIDKIVAVEKLDEIAFKMKNMFEIVQNDRSIYLRAANCVEQKEWIDMLTKLSLVSANRRAYHPCAYRINKWICCGYSSIDTPGCVAVRAPNDYNHLILDPERDLQRIHNLILSNIGRLEKLCNTTVNGGAAAPATATAAAAATDYYQQFEILTETEYHLFLRNLSTLKEIVYSLDHKHRIYQRFLLRNIKVGSKSTPIGDDNYMQLGGKLLFN